MSRRPEKNDKVVKITLIKLSKGTFEIWIHSNEKAIRVSKGNESQMRYNKAKLDKFFTDPNYKFKAKNMNELGKMAYNILRA